ncbi:unnamed protein product [Ascophyllum nodosum]
MNAAGNATPPLIIFKGQSVQAAWVRTGGPPGTKFAATDSSFMQGPVFVNYVRNFHQYIVENGLADGKPHILVFDGHALRVNLEVIQLAMSLNIALFQLPSLSSHITQALDVAVFGCFKKAVTAVLTSFPQQHGGQKPGKSDVAGVIKEAWAASFTVPQIKASFEGAGLWPVDMERGINRLHGTKRKARPDDRPQLADVAVVISEKELISSLGAQAAKKLQRSGHAIAGVRSSIVFLGEFLKAQEREKEADRLREERATARAANRAAKETAANAKVS